LLIVTGYLYAQWSDWFTRAELESIGKRPFYCDSIDLRKPGPVQWLVSLDAWSFQEGKTKLGLLLSLNSLREISAGRALTIRQS
jgi:hypothetical protein